MVNETSSTHQSVAVTGVHRFTVAGHSLLKGTDPCIKSTSFPVGGHDWAIHYYLDGYKGGEAKQEHVSVYVSLLNPAVKGDVTASFSFCLIDPASPASTAGINVMGATRKFSSINRTWGYADYMSNAGLAASGCIKDDCLVIKCTVKVITSKLINNGNEEDEDTGAGVAVPPADLDSHLGRLLETGAATDITIKIGWFRQFKAHRCVLAARSPVFRALLCGSMMESTQSSIRVEGVDANVFKILLQYMYDDSMPAFMEETTNEDATNLTKDLLIAADRYGVERLKLICERKLSMVLDVNTVCSTLEFADRHSCQQLKNCCLAFVVKDRDRLKAIVKTEGYEQLTQNCAHLVSEVFVKSVHTD